MTFDIPVKSVVKILVHFGRSLPVFFIYVKPSTAANIRRLLKMTDRNGYYFDPCSHGKLLSFLLLHNNLNNSNIWTMNYFLSHPNKLSSPSSDESQKRITILPDRLTEENKNLVKEVFGPSNLLNNCGAATGTSTSSEPVNVIEELDHKEANEILLRASSAKVCKRVQYTINVVSVHARKQSNYTKNMVWKFYYLEWCIGLCFIISCWIQCQFHLYIVSWYHIWASLSLSARNILMANVIWNNFWIQFSRSRI